MDNNDTPKKIMTLEIDNFGPIADAKIDLGKINIIGGRNSTGKSTSSKLLYCFLKADSVGNLNLISEPITPLMFDLMVKLDSIYKKYKDDFFDLYWAYEDADDYIKKLRAKMYHQESIPSYLDLLALYAHLDEMYTTLESAIHVDDEKFSLDELRKLNEHKKFLDKKLKDIQEKLDALRNGNTAMFKDEYVIFVNDEAEHLEETLSDQYSNCIYEMHDIVIKENNLLKQKSFF